MLTDKAARKFRMTDLQRVVYNRNYPNSKLLIQPTDHMYRCFGLRDSKVIFSPIPVRKLEVSQAFCRGIAYL
jgi:hypothetical protein